MKSLAVLLAGTALAIGANAATVSFNFSNPLQTTEINQTGALGLFNSSLGTLTGVTLKFTGANSTNLSLTNTAAQAQTTRATSTTDLFWGSSLGSLNALITAANPVISLSATTGFQTIAAGGTASFGPLVDNQSKTWTSALELSSITSAFSVAGGGNFDLTCSSISGLALQGGGGNIRSTQATQAGCSAEIVYEYTAKPVQVPEPASLALVGLALAGLGFARRKANKA